jgi:hypothetical protein
MASEWENREQDVPSQSEPKGVLGGKSDNHTDSHRHEDLVQPCFHQPVPKGHAGTAPKTTNFLITSDEIH